MLAEREPRHKLRHLSAADASFLQPEWSKYSSSSLSRSEQIKRTSVTTPFKDQTRDT
jgi:hypothetical protein